MSTVTVAEAISKALPGAATSQAATTAPAGPQAALTWPIVTLLAIGTWCMLCWVTVRLCRRRRLYLRNTPGRPNRLNMLHIIGLLLVYYAVPLLAGPVLARAMGTDLKQDNPPLSLMVAVTVLTQLVLLAASLKVASMTFRHGLGRGLGLRGDRWLWDIARGVGGMLIVLPAVFGTFLLSVWVSESLLGIPRKIHPLLVQLPDAPLGWQVAGIVGAVVVAPLAEEVFFRGLLQSALRPHLSSPWPAVILASLVFALMHSGPEPQAVPSLFVLAVALGYNYERTGRLWPSIVLHASFNAAMIWVRFAS